LDNPELYQKYNATSMQTALMTSLSGSHYDVAQVVYSMFKFEFVSTKDGKNNNTWYKFGRHRWEESVGGVDLRNKLSTNVYKAYIAMSKDMGKKARAEAKCSDDDEDKDDSGDQFRKIAKRLKNHTFKCAIMKECADIFYMSDKEFTSKLNESPHLLVFDNGVYDLDAMVFRPGRPNDFLTFTTGYNYNPESDPKMRKVLYSLLKSIYGTDELVRYMLEFGAYTLHGSKNDEIIHFWVWKGGNGKGTMDKLYDVCLGDYYYQPDVSIFTGGKRSSSSADDEIAKGKGKRMWVMTEPGTVDKFNTAELKKKSGRDRIQARHLYKRFVEYIAHFVLVFQMNNKSALDSYDGGMLRRLRLIEHLFQFVENPTNPHERQGDTDLKDKILNDDVYRQEFMRMLIEIYVDIQLNGGPRPQRRFLTSPSLTWTPTM
jgi:phage/plasmid-associated DNA primase